MPDRRPLLPLVLAALAIGACLAPAVGEAAKPKLEQPRAVRVETAGTTTVTVAWKDQSKGERRYEVRAEAPNDAIIVADADANARRARLKGLDRGTPYGISVTACGRSGRCGSPGFTRAATLLAPFGGPHPALGCDVFPSGDDFNTPVTGLPTAARSNQIVAGLAGDLHPDFGSNPRYGIPYVVVPPFQPEASIRFTAYGDESDPGPYPIPPGAPVEGGRNADGDRHVLVVKRPGSHGEGCALYELYRSFEKGGPRNLWTGDSGSVFDLGSQLLGQRPDGWTSADAAGLPIFPGLVTKEEVDTGVIDHAIRITFEETRRAYIRPATHYASDSCEADLPAMGERFRLKAGYSLDGMTGDARVIATALKQYGAIVADNGSDWFISGSTDRRWDDDDLNQLKEIPGSAFEVVRPLRPTIDAC